MKSLHIQDDLEHERLLLRSDNNLAKEETLKQMEVATLKERNRISTPCTTKSDTRQRFNYNWGITNYQLMNPVVEKKNKFLVSFQNGMDEVWTTIHQLYDDSFLLSSCARWTRFFSPTWREGTGQLSKIQFLMRFQSIEARHSYYL